MQSRLLSLLAPILLLIAVLHAQSVLTPGNVVSSTAKANDLVLFKVDQTNAGLTGLDIVLTGCNGKVNVYVNNCAKNDVCNNPTKERHTGSVTISVNSTSQGAVTALSICLSTVCAPNRVYLLGVEPAENGDRSVDFQIVLNTYTNNKEPVWYTNDGKLKLDFNTNDLTWAPATYCTEKETMGFFKCKTSAPVPNAKYTVYYTTLGADSTNTVNMGTECGLANAKTFADKIKETKAPTKLEKNAKYLITVKMEGDNGMTSIYDTILYTNTSSGDPSALWKFLLMVGLTLGGVCCGIICCVAVVVVLAVVFVKLVVTKPTYTQVP